MNRYLAQSRTNLKVAVQRRMALGTQGYKIVRRVVELVLIYVVDVQEVLRRLKVLIAQLAGISVSFSDDSSDGFPVEGVRPRCDATFPRGIVRTTDSTRQGQGFGLGAAGNTKAFETSAYSCVSDAKVLGYAHAGLTARAAAPDISDNSRRQLRIYVQHAGLRGRV